MQEARGTGEEEGRRITGSEGQARGGGASGRRTEEEEGQAGGGGSKWRVGT